jgi:glutathione synthase/RimK-type ligase-like ATP-grasp enzyme
MNGLFRPRLRHLVINWGSATRPGWWVNGLNNPDIVRRSSNKLIALQTLKAAGVSVPEFTTDQAEAQRWIRDGKVVVGRRILNGSQGIGCVVWETETATAERVPLYTRHLRHKREFRIHVFRGRVIDMVEKLKRRGFENRNAWIRNHNNGYVFARGNINVPNCVISEAIRAASVLGLDFGAVDVAYREKENRAYIFEVNSAPGIEGTTINSYANAIRQELQSRQ